MNCAICGEEIKFEWEIKFMEDQIVHDECLQNKIAEARME